RLEAAVDADLERGVLLRELRGEPGETDRSPELLAPTGARDASARASGPHHLAALGRHRPVCHLEADEQLARAALLRVFERPLADEVVLLELDDPGHVRVERIRLRVRVLTDDDVLLLEPEDPLRLEAERLRAEVGAAFEQGVPQILAVRAREMEIGRAHV